MNFKTTLIDTFLQKQNDEVHIPSG